MRSSARRYRAGMATRRSLRWLAERVDRASAAAMPDAMAKFTPRATGRPPGTAPPRRRRRASLCSRAGHPNHLGDEVGGVLLQLAAADERGDRRVLLQPGDQLLGPLCLGGQRRQREHEADAERVEVRVENPPPARRRCSRASRCRRRRGRAREAPVDDVLRQREHLLDAEREIGRRRCACRGRPPWRESCSRRRRR